MHFRLRAGVTGLTDHSVNEQVESTTRTDNPYPLSHLNLPVLPHLVDGNPTRLRSLDGPGTCCLPLGLRI